MSDSSVSASTDSDDEHVAVLEAAFKLMSSSPSQVVITGRGSKKVSLPRDVLVLFSPLVRSLLADLPCHAHISAPLLSLPDVSASSLLKLQDILSLGHCQDSLSLKQTKELLDACQLLGLDIKKLHIGQERTEGHTSDVTVNLDSVDTRERDISAIIQQRRTEGNQIILTKSFKKQTKPSSVGFTESKEPMVVVKKENVFAGDEVQSQGFVQEKMETEQPAAPPPPSPSREKYQCEKCKKVQETALLLKYHYCSHYMDVLRKRFDGHEDSKKNICFICKKTHPNNRRLLLHIGVNHDKINDVLKLKGFKQLPPAPEKAGDTKKSSRGGGTVADKRSFDIRSMMDVKTATASTPPPGPSPPAPTLTPSLTSPSPRADSPAAVKPREKNPLVSECNFSLECQVCKQKLDSFHALEQHCCRHFMKEMAEQFSGIMEGLKCGICNLAFKQKHSLLLHIGCKHGKINDILKQKGYIVLPAPMVNNSNGAHQMQIRLLEIKKEKAEDNQVKKEETSQVKLNEVLNKFSVPSI